MTPEARDRAATLLIEARRGNAPLSELPAACRPATVVDGYAIQDAVTARLGLKVIGRKLGCTSADQQRNLGVDGPFIGRMFAETSHRSGATLPGDSFVMRGIEGEFAFRLGRDLPARATPWTRQAVAAAVASLHPAIEIVCTRFRDWRAAGVGAPSLVADNGAHGAFIEGEGIADWQRFDLARHRVALAVDGKPIAEGSGAAVLGNPLEALTWAANECARLGQPLAAGDIVSTGTCIGIHLVAPNARVECDFGPLGRVAVSLAPASSPSP